MHQNKSDMNNRYWKFSFSLESLQQTELQFQSTVCNEHIE
mgnify:CR=1 FL=1